ncbi:MAG: YkgJ family cysteine cluster protein [Desulfonatronovibrio sp.]
MNSQQSCLKCGTCCEKNGPVLHVEDLSLVKNGILIPENLVLLRRGEPAMDNIAQKPVLLKRELIKIRGKSPESWACVFHDSASKLCMIHKDRPAQCRIMECWNPEGITSSYQENTLSRKDIFARGSALEEIMLMHEEKCPVESFTGLMRIEISTPGQADQEINRMISFDNWFRKIFQEKSGASSRVLDYYFGRPLERLVEPVTRFINNNR